MMMESIPERRCARCAHSKQSPGGMLECWLNPPTPIPVIMPDNLGRPQISMIFSIHTPVTPTHYCGQWKLAFVVVDSEIKAG